MDYETSARNRLEDMLLDESAEPIILPLSLLRAITNDFSYDREIGNGAFAVVYKGVLQNGTVAVKKPFHTFERDEERFNQEVRCLRRVRHKNIIRFLGYCADTQGEMHVYNGKDVMADRRSRLLCLEYVAGGSLNNYITDVSLRFQWRINYQIIRGICEGLHHLHKESIVHSDLGPNNILLDDSMVPKICGFGNSVLFHEDQKQEIIETSTRSQGHLAPERFHGVITFKTDIYDLGVIITEILTGQKEYPSIVNVMEGWRNWLGASGEDTMLEQIRVCAEICIRCLDSNPNKRPATQNIIEALVEMESMTPDTERIIEMLNDTESMIEFIKDGMGTLLQAEEPSNGVQQGTRTISRMESSEIMELNILERILAGSEEPNHLDLPLVQRITENFSEKKRIGVGGCGEVYKGIIQNGVVAVKRLFKSRTIKDKMFHREVKSLITVRHHNIVRFLGYCSFTSERVASFEGVTIMVDIRERLLCFEYISNGSLESHLTDELRGLDWHTRYEIIVGICKGLFYLHKEKHIVHMDLKPANILLDDDMVPKITDFGLSRHDTNSQTTTTSRLISPGYCAPEYLFEGKSSSKSDIYSLGVIITEVVTGSRKKMPNITKVRVIYEYMLPLHLTPFHRYAYMDV
ncbi:unnamed protein product [Urochloa decumbens]|uniref:non-specific serine/threonine protein kinase n=1 Tax=Urochloa decumbens TaxID=240449 RepID=A0ABC9AS49_9POAL